MTTSSAFFFDFPSSDRNDVLIDQFKFHHFLTEKFHVSSFYSRTFLCQLFQYAHRAFLVQLDFPPESVVKIVDYAYQVIGRSLAWVLREWASHTHDENRIFFGMKFINLVEEALGSGKPHPLHKHPLMECAAGRIFATTSSNIHISPSHQPHKNMNLVVSSTSWNCHICNREACVVKDTVFRCAECNLNICRECFTRVPNIAPTLMETTTVEQHFSAQTFASKYYAHYLPGRNTNDVNINRSFSFIKFGEILTYAIHHLCDLDEKGRDLSMRLGHTVRSRYLELLPPKTSSSAVQLDRSNLLFIFERLLKSSSFRACLISREDWIPSIMTDKRMENCSFLGPFLSSRIILIGKQSRTETKQFYESHINLIHSQLLRLFKLLLSVDNEEKNFETIRQATLCWLSCCVQSNSIRRKRKKSTQHEINRFSDAINSTDEIQSSFSYLLHLNATYNDGQVLTNCSAHLTDIKYNTDIFLLNISHILLELVQPFLSSSDMNEGLYCKQQGKTESEFPLEDSPVLPTGMSFSPIENFPVLKKTASSYYPKWQQHYGVVCDHCQYDDLYGVRYKCTKCPDFDLCEYCFAQYATNRISFTQPHDDHHSHCFVRLPISIPHVVNDYFLQDHSVLSASGASTRNLEVEKKPWLCDICQLQKNCKDNYFYKCGNCDREVCAACLSKEEELANGNPYYLHEIGHHYIVFFFELSTSRSQRHEQFKFERILYPNVILSPTVSFGNQLFHLTLAFLHYGLMFSLHELSELDYLINHSLFPGENKKQYIYEEFGRMNEEYQEKMANRKEVLIAVENQHFFWQVVLFTPRFSQFVSGFYSCTSQRINKLIEDRDPMYAQLKQYVLYDLADFMQLYYTFMRQQEELHVQSSFESILVLCMQMIGNAQVTPSTTDLTCNLRAQFSQVLLTLLTATSNQVEEVRYYFNSNLFLHAHSLSFLENFYSDLIATPLSDPCRRPMLLYWNNIAENGGDMTNFRSTVLYFYRFFSTLNTFRQSISDRSRDLVSLFVEIFDDLLRLVDDIASKMKLIFRLHCLNEHVNPCLTIEKNKNQFSRLDRRRIRQNLQHPNLHFQRMILVHLEHTRYYMRLVMEMLEHILWVSNIEQFNELILLRPELRQQTISTLCYVMNIFYKELQEEETNWKDICPGIYEDGRVVLSQIALIFLQCFTNLQKHIPREETIPFASWQMLKQNQLVAHRLFYYGGKAALYQRWRLSCNLAELILHKHQVRETRQYIDKALIEDCLTCLVNDGHFNISQLRFFFLPSEFDAPDNSYWKSELEGLIQQIEKVETINQTLEESLGEIPERFIDPLLQSLMKTPVKLPSGHIVDRPVIERHLLTQSVNPFTRDPLTVEMLEPCLSLQREIEVFVSKARNHA